MLMSSDSLALISARLNAQINASQALSNTQESGTNKQIQFFEASVVSAMADKKGGFDILIQALNGNNNQTLTLNSKFPIPVNSLLLLKLEQSVVDSAQDEKANPAQTSSTNAVQTTNSKTNSLNPPSNTLQPQNSQTANKTLELSLISHTQPESTKSSSAITSLNSQTPSVVRDWIASRIPILLNLDGQKPPNQNMSETTPLNQPNINTGNAEKSNQQISSEAFTAKLEALYKTSSSQSELPKLPSISQSLSRLIANIKNLPEPAQVPLRDWLESLPQKLSMSQTGTIKSQLQNSGQFFENKLTQQLFSLTKAQAQSMYEAGVKQAPSQSTLKVQTENNESLNKSNKQTLNANKQTVPIAKQALNSSLNNSKTNQLFQLLWGKLKPEQASAAKNALESSFTEETSSAKQVLASVKAKLEGLSNLSFKQSSPIWASQLQHGDLKLALAQSLIKTLQFNSQQGLINGQDAQQAIAGRIPLNINPNNLLNETQQLLQQTLAQLEVDQQQQINDERPTHHAQLYFRDNQQLQQVQIELLEKGDEQSKSHAKKKAQQWRIRLHFELANLGELGVEINLSPPKAAAAFWSTQSHTLKALQTAIAPLRARLQHQGVEVTDLQVRHGSLPESTKNSIQQQLIDIHT